MEAGRNFLSSPPSFPSRNHPKNTSYSFSVLKPHERAAPAVSSVPTLMVARHFPTSVLLQELRDEYRSLLHMSKEDKTSLATTDRRELETEASLLEENSNNLDQLVQDFEHQLLHLPDLWNLLPPGQAGVNHSFSTMQSRTNNTEEVELFNAVALAKKALSASTEAASLAENPKLYGDESDDIISTSSSNFPLDEVKIVRSTRLFERQSKKRRSSKPQVMVSETCRPRKSDTQRKLNEGFNPRDPLRLFLWGPETRQLLTVKEESECIVQIQNLMRLEKVKSKLETQFGREPTLIEWAEAVELNCRDLQSELQSGNISREKLINANLRLVVHVAKQYQGRGLNLQDLLQEGSMGLMKSVEKFKPQAGCRFPSYAYWWIRQTIRKAIFQHSRTIRLPDNVYTLLSKVLEAKRLCIQKGNHDPNKEELATRAGITVEKLERLLFLTRRPLSMQQPVWADQDTTFQEIIADTGIEIPDVSVAKQLMRRHVRNLLNVLNPRERRVIRLRFGIEDGKPKSLSEIGNMFGLSKERVRQLENRALYRLRQSLGSEALGGYVDLLV